MKRLIWSGVWRETTVMNEFGVLLRVRFLPSSSTWGYYVGGELRGKSDSREGAKKLALRSRRERPLGRSRCPACHGTGYIQ